MFIVRLWTLLLLAIAVLAACDRGPAAPSAAPASAPPPPAPQVDTLTLLFPYGSEKKAWLEDVTAAFNASNRRVGDKLVRVEPRAMGSGDSVRQILDGHLEAHLVSPASAAFIELGNAESRAETGGDLVGPTQNLVLSPVVIAMWKPMAEALGWPGTPLGWADVAALAADERGWAAHGFPQWGRFRFGHTHPEYSNSGLISVLAAVYAGAGKQRGLTSEDLARPEVGDFLAGVQRSVVHYGESTGFFGRKLFENGPGYLSAAVLYENMVVEAYDPAKYQLPFPVVAIYPKEGTFWSDHPVGVVQRPWVTKEHQDAAAQYVAFLLERAQQEKAMAFGFRPGDPSLALAAPLDAAHGIDPAEPKTTLEVPPADVLNGVVQLWRERKKPADVVLVIDTSGSMKGEAIVQAKAGAQQLIDMLHPADTLSLLAFSDAPRWAERDLSIKDGQGRAKQVVDSYFADGGTALYDATAEAYRYLAARQSADSIAAVVVLTDGEDTESKTKLDALLNEIGGGPEAAGVRVFTIAYGDKANPKVLEEIANRTNAKSFKGDPKNVREVFKEISTFF